MVWNDEQIIQWAASGGITPFNVECVNPASIDLRWSGRYKVTLNYEKTVWSSARELNVLTIYPGSFLLLDTMEYIKMPETAAGLLMLKSSIGRMGLEHLHAGYFDPGFHGTATLEMYNVTKMEINITKGQRLVQLMLLDMIARPQKPYAEVGRYAGQKEPQEAREPR